MENFNNDLFKFNVEDSNDSMDFQSNSLYDESINSFNENDYENANLFNLEVDQENIDFNQELENDAVLSNSVNMLDDYTNLNNMYYQSTNEMEENISNPVEQVDYNNSENMNYDSNFENENYYSNIENVNYDDSIENENYNTNIENMNVEQNEEVNTLEENKIDDTQSTEDEFITFSDTPIEDLNKLTEYEQDNIDTTDINSLFDRVSINVKDASEIFRKNTDLKQKIDSRFEELKKLQVEVANSRQNQIDEINAYKEEVYSKLTEKKEEIEKRLNLLKETQISLDKEKKEFELYKKQEQENIDKIQKEVQSAYDDRREELGRIEDILRKQKDSLDEERNQLSLDRIQYEADKNDLANNLLKFNELVNSFTNGMTDIKE